MAADVLSRLDGRRTAAPAHSDAGSERAEAREGMLRAGVASLVLYCLLQAVVGVVWDVQWHATLGRDSFWIPPHLMLYSGIAVGGLACVAFVLRETLRYYQGFSGVDGRATVAVLGAFRAPLGVALSGFGFLAVLFAAPFDNYWHGLYGIDVTLWAPFHVMGLLGAGIALLGLFYSCGDLLRRASAGMAPARPIYAGLLLSLTVELLITTGLLVEPSVWDHQLLTLGPANLALYPLLVVPSVSLALVAAALTVPWRGGATALAAVFTALRVALAWIVPPLMQFSSAATGDSYRDSAPTFAVIPFVLPAFLLAYGVIVDLLVGVGRRRRGGRHLVLAMAAGALVGLTLTLLDRPWAAGLSDNGYAASAARDALPATLLAAMGIGALAGWLGHGLAVALRQAPGGAGGGVKSRQLGRSVALAAIGFAAVVAVPTWIVVAPPPEMADGVGWAIGLSPLLGVALFGLAQWRSYRPSRTAAARGT